MNVTLRVEAREVLEWNREEIRGIARKHTLTLVRYTKIQVRLLITSFSSMEKVYQQKKRKKEQVLLHQLRVVVTQAGNLKPASALALAGNGKKSPKKKSSMTNGNSRTERVN